MTIFYSLGARSDTNQAMQLQKMCGSAVDLRLYFSHMQKACFLMTLPVNSYYPKFSARNAQPNSVDPDLFFNYSFYSSDSPLLI